MKGACIVVLLLVLLFSHEGAANPLFKVFCSGTPLFRGRLDSIVSPGQISGHVHKVAGGNGFGPATASQTPQQVFNDMRASTCTTCSIKTVDLSAYWHPELYYQWPNGTLSLVPKGGLTAYYLFRNGYGAQATPKWKAFPAGFRMVSGNPFRRTFNSSNVAHRAINFACLSEPGGSETNGLELVKTRFCKNGLRLQVHFPQCWDGVNVDSPSHTTHVSFPIQAPDGGDCPSTHPVRLPNIFFEAFYSVDQFPHGTGTQPFVLACGDKTGYGFHGDFLNGWDVNVLQAAIDNSTCEQTNTNNGNDVRKCLPLAPFVQDVPSGGVCELSKDSGLNEHVGFGAGMSALPGNNPITSGPTDAAIPSFGPTSDTYKLPATQRFLLKSVQTGKYATARGVSSNSITVTSTSTTYHEVFTTYMSSGNWFGIISESLNKYLTAGGDNSALIADRDSVSGWEQFQFIAQSGGRVCILSNRNGKYISVQSNNALAPTFDPAGTPGNAQLFELVVPSGGSL